MRAIAGVVPSLGLEDRTLSLRKHAYSNKYIENFTSKN